ncbi:hypothetical protein [Cohaesibacter celericrescens]|uniref:Uncharacterized protein n=1 Tax=Cohaesibacter celericrescens TaxID=2067669 RepID=A0A2N5XQM4_9HYPH|nr:hypothetical protein [Cohaesibacter celericrescens]PLW76821.1 hypothetical protein C0081_12230 [Cohaesibacter celericrescens]
MLKPRQKSYRPSVERLETRRIRVGLVEARGLNAPVVSMAGPWTAKNWRERNLFLHEAIELRDRLNEILPTEERASND